MSTVSINVHTRSDQQRPSFDKAAFGGGLQLKRDAGWSADRYSAEVPAAVTTARFDGRPPVSCKSEPVPRQAAIEAREKPQVAKLNELQALEVAASASDIPSGDKLFAAGRLEDALTVYKRRVESFRRTSACFRNARMKLGEPITRSRRSVPMRTVTAGMSFLTISKPLRRGKSNTP